MSVFKASYGNRVKRLRCLDETLHGNTVSYYLTLPKYFFVFYSPTADQAVKLKPQD